MAATLRELSGLEFFESWARGEFTPPICATLGFALDEFSEGRASFVMKAEEFHYNPYGLVHGGPIATLLDTATGCAIHTRLPARAGYVTLNLETSFIRPVTVESGTLTCTGRVISMGRRVAVADADLVDETGRLVARATATCLVMLPE